MYPRDVDDREFGPEPDSDDCPRCGARWCDPCEPECDCAYCLRRQEQRRAALELEMVE